MLQLRSTIFFSSLSPVPTKERWCRTRLDSVPSPLLPATTAAACHRSRYATGAVAAALQAAHAAEQEALLQKTLAADQEHRMEQMRDRLASSRAPPVSRIPHSTTTIIHSRTVATLRSAFLQGLVSSRVQSMQVRNDNDGRTAHDSSATNGSGKGGQHLAAAVCFDFTAGRCARGSSCKFAHIADAVWIFLA